MSVSPKKKARRAAERAAQAADADAQHLTVALVGRPNVGKSSLFNKLVGRRLAIVDSTPGTTRDWKEAEGHIGSLRFTVMDTGGLEDEASKRRDGRPSRGDTPSFDAIETKMLAHTAAAIARADVVLFMVDAEAGVGAEEVKFARWLKRLRASQGFAGENQSIALVVNKADKFGSFAFDGAGAAGSSSFGGAVASADAAAALRGDHHDADVEAALLADLTPKQRRKREAAAAAAELAEQNAEADGAAAAADSSGDWSSANLSEVELSAALDAGAAEAGAASSSGGGGSGSRAAAKAADGRLRWARLERDCFALGLGAPIPIAAESRIGFSDLHNVLFEAAVRKGSAPQRRGSVGSTGSVGSSSTVDEVADGAAFAPTGKGHATPSAETAGAAEPEAEDDFAAAAAAEVGAGADAVPEAIAAVDSALADALLGLDAGLDAELAQQAQQTQSKQAKLAKGKPSAAAPAASSAGNVEGAAAELDVITTEASADADADAEAEADAASADPAAAAALEARLNAEAAAAAAKPIQMAVVGRPNVGKSSLVNQLLGERRLLTGPTAGLTRDPTTVTMMAPPLRNRGDPLPASDGATGAAAAGGSSSSASGLIARQGQGQPVQIVDTAGMRRWGSWDLSTPLEGAAVGAAKKALQRANVVVLVVDASGGTRDSLTDVPQALLTAAAASSAAGRGGSAAAGAGAGAAQTDPLALLSGSMAQGKRGKHSRAKDQGRGSAASASAPGAVPSPVSSGPAAVAAAGSTRGVRSSRELPGAGLTRQDLTIAEQVLEEGRGLVVVVNKVDTLAPGAALLAARAAARAAAEAVAANAAASAATAARGQPGSSGGSDGEADADADANGRPQSQLEAAAAAVVARAEGMMQLRQLVEADARAAAAAKAKAKAAKAGADADAPLLPEEHRQIFGDADADADADAEAAEAAAPGGSAAASIDPAMAAARAHASLLKHPNVARVLTFVRSQLDAMVNGAGVEIVPVSSLTGAGRERVLPAVQRTFARWNARVGTATLNRWLALIQRHHPPPATTVTISSARPDENGHRPTKRVPIRLKFLAQTAARPPTFTLYVNRAGNTRGSSGKGKGGKGGSSSGGGGGGGAGGLPESYTRYLANALRREFSLGGVPVRLRIRAAVNPYRAKAAAQAAARRRRHAALGAGGRSGPGRKRRLQLRRPQPRVRPSSSAAKSEAGGGDAGDGRGRRPLSPGQLKRGAAAKGAPGAFRSRSTSVSRSGSGSASGSAPGSGSGSASGKRRPAAGWQSKAKAKAAAAGGKGSGNSSNDGSSRAKKASFRQGRSAAVAARGARQQRGGVGGRR